MLQIHNSIHNALLNILLRRSVCVLKAYRPKAFVGGHPSLQRTFLYL